MCPKKVWKANGTRSCSVSYEHKWKVPLVDNFEVILRTVMNHWARKSLSAHARVISPFMPGRQYDMTMLTVGFILYACGEDDADRLKAGRPLDQNWFSRRNYAGVSTFIDTRYIVSRIYTYADISLPALSPPEYLLSMSLSLRLRYYRSYSL